MHLLKRLAAVLAAAWLCLAPAAADPAANFALLPLISAQATTAQDGDGIAQIAFQAGSPAAPIDLTGISFSLQWHPANGGIPNTTIVSVSAGQYLSNGGATGILTLTIPQAKLRILPVGTYAASLVASLNGSVADLGVITITHSAIGSSAITALSTTARNAATATSIGYVPGPQGASAYQVAVQNGFSGTQSQWLASLVGATGSTGPQGAIGPTGTAGAQGIQGSTGATGPQPWQTPPAAWAASTSYTATAPASVVTYGGETYVASTSHTSTSTFDASKWTKIAAKGADGTSNSAYLPAPTATSSNTTLVSGDADRPILATGSPTITMANGGAGWLTGPIRNANTSTGLVTLAVPSGATLDGTTNGTTVLYPYQRARIIQTGATAYITDWIDRSPIIAQVSQAGASSATFILPAGYGSYELVFRGAEPSINAANLIAQLSDDGGATFKAGSSDYGYQIQQNTSTTFSGSSTNSASFPITAAISTGYGGGHGRIEVQANASGLPPTYSVRSGSVPSGYGLQLVEGACLSITTNRVNALKLAWSSGTGPLNVTARAVP